MQTDSPIIDLGETALKRGPEPVHGEYVAFLGETYYRISNYDALPPFFMSLVSDADHWLYIASTGGLTAGRINPDAALFPYYTEDRLTENSENTGSKTILRVAKQGCAFLWEPFSSNYLGVYRVQRNLYKNIVGNTLVFEETNADLKTTFCYAWQTSGQYGFVRTAWLQNDGAEPCTIELLDGLQNLLPYGVTRKTQLEFSVLLDAYKRNELEPSARLGIFTLSSTLTDLAEPSESLQATTVWQAGLEQAQYLLSSAQLDRFRRGLDVTPETDVRGVRGAFFVQAQFDLAAAEAKTWQIVADVNQDHARIAALINQITRRNPELAALVRADIARGTENLTAIVARADGLQVSADRLSAAHHFANVLFNTMRGGIFAAQNQIAKADLMDFVATRNIGVIQDHGDFFTSLPQAIGVQQLCQQVGATGSADLARLCYEYLPLTFSRRHGDPSRPWNLFAINLKKADGSPKLDYQGNWRDIFQNWEPLAYSYPEFVESLICKFLNATTADGYNPYRVTRHGVEWEKPEPGNPWANIGYWGDHQIIYLQKLLEISVKFHPGTLRQMLPRNMFSHANVPYKIKPYEALLANWSATIEFDREQDGQIEATVKRLGTDGRLLLDGAGRVWHVNLMEKLLLLLLTKLSNFVPEGGIWLNTQRPEWNDANNALVGKGLSVVTVCYLRRFIAFLLKLLPACADADFALTREVHALFTAIYETLARSRNLLMGSFDDTQRRAIMDALGQAGSAYRLKIYRGGFAGDFEHVRKETMLAFLEMALNYVEQTIRANQRPDGLYHAYNILHLGDGTASVSYLHEMLEGQVAVLSAGMLSPAEALAVLQALRTSQLYRADQHSYILYPNRELPGFLQKNCLNPAQVKDSQLIARLVEQNDRSLVVRDENGNYHFNGAFRNAKDVQNALAMLQKREFRKIEHPSTSSGRTEDTFTAIPPVRGEPCPERSRRGVEPRCMSPEKDSSWADLVAKETPLILQLFEVVFDHRSFTGRSGTFFAYEGLGSIYWHMVAKLLLAAQEVYLQAVERGENPARLKALADHYYEIRNGIGFNKTPEEYGAFPTDPYSHTPAGRGAQQPGMTGQVKEEILTRFGEMGLCIKDGTLSFTPGLLREQEFTKHPQIFTYVDVAGQKQALTLAAGSFAYTFGQVPIVYNAVLVNKTMIVFADGRNLEMAGNSLDAELSRHIFQRDGYIKQITVLIRRGTT